MNDTNNKSLAIFMPSGCLTADGMTRFVSGTLSHTEKVAVKQHLFECPLCTDATEGMRLWLVENKSSSESDMNSVGSDVAETSGIKKSHPGKSPFATKPLSTPAYPFHNRTKEINERIKQRVIFHKQVDAAEEKRIHLKPYIWVGIAATLALFLSIFYVLQQQNLFDKKSTAQEKPDETEIPAVAQKPEINADSTISINPVLALNDKKRKASASVTLDSDNETESTDMDAILHMESVTDEFQLPVVAEETESDLASASRAEIAEVEARDFDTSWPGITEQPVPVEGVVVTAYGIAKEKKSLGNATTETRDAKAQTSESKVQTKSAKNREGVKENGVFTVVEQMPEFPGGENARFEFLSKNIVYPTLAAENGIQGTVYLSFIVKKDGRITDARILRGIGGGCDEEALRVVRNMPPWKPGKQNGKHVDVLFNMPVIFKLSH